MTSDPVAAEKVLQDLSELRHDLQTIRINAAQTYELYDNLSTRWPSTTMSCPSIPADWLCCGSNTGT